MANDDHSADDRNALLRRLNLSTGPERLLIPDLYHTLHCSAVGRAVLFSRSATNPVGAGHTTTFQVAVPIAGAFTWRVGKGAALVDANTALFISGAQEYVEAHPVKGLGHACIIAAPSPEVLHEFRSPVRTGADPFASRARVAGPRVHLLAHRLLNLSGDGDALFRDVLMLEFLSEAAHAQAPRSCRDLSIAAKAKEFLHGLHGARVSLMDAAQALGVTPIYLTQAFKASEGVPFYRYHLNLRLAQALLALPSSESITELALGLGFSTHSHFSACFVARYGITPSECRAAMRPRRHPVISPAASQPSRTGLRP